MELILQFVLLVVGFAMLGKGADWFVDGAAGIAARFGIPQLIIGLTIVAMGTSAPEAAVSITAALKGSADITIGNILGSNIINVWVILGMASLITTLAVSRSTIRVDIPVVLFSSCLLLYQGWDGSVGFTDGVILILLFSIYIYYLYTEAIKHRVEKDDDGCYGFGLRHCFIWAVLGMVAIVLGSEITVRAATSIALFAGFSERFIGLTVVALGTSLPELFTSVAATLKGNADIAIGNIVGSNLFNLLFVVGLSALITDVQYSASFLFDSYVNIGMTLLLWLCVLTSGSLKRWHGALMLGCYLVYFYFIL